MSPRLPILASALLPLAPLLAAPSAYDPRETFAPLTLPDPAGPTRSVNGLPGAHYWQNRADYTIEATLDPRAKTIEASETIAYTNNSPDALDSLWLHLDQNIYRPDARAHFGADRGKGELDGHTSGYTIDAVEVEQGGKRTLAGFFVTDTRMEVRLPAPLAAKGGALRLHMRYRYTIPGAFGGRTAWGKAKAGEIYDIAQWYPRMAVYDDLRGWDTLPYLAQEFYLEYGDFDYRVTLPADMLVAGSGELLNPEEVLSATERARLEQARRSDATVTIRSAAEAARAAARPPATATRTWHFRMTNTRDVAFSASRVFLWDAARIALGNRTALAQSFYPAESAGRDRWSRSTEYLKHAVETFSHWYPYPWPNAVNVAGPVDGMEYPGLLFDGINDAGKDLFWITAHEIGHSWFPMIVGFNERRDAWMDEGFNTFIDTEESDTFNQGEYAPKRDEEYAPGGGNPVDDILPLLADREAPAILSRADTVPEKYRHPVTYFKSALGLVLLREQILGPERFDPAFRRFIAGWAYKHPSPSDFFRAMENGAGEDLSWWWRGWYFHNWSLDLAVTDVRYVEGDPAKGVEIAVAALDKLILPATLRVAYRDGSRRDIRLPAETWIRHAASVVTLRGGPAIASVTLDPDHAIPDKDRANNVFRMKP